MGCFVIRFYSVERRALKKGKNIPHVQLAQGDSNHSSQLLVKANSRFPKQADLKAAATRSKSQRQNRVAKPRECAAAKSLQCGQVLWGGRCAIMSKGEAWTKPPLYDRNHLLLTWTGVKSGSLTSLSRSTGTAATTACFAFGGPGAVSVSTGLQLSYTPLHSTS